MSALKHGARMLAALALLGLTACGGGGGGTPPPSNNADTTPTSAAPVASVPAEGTLVVTATAGASSLAKQTYQLDTSYDGAVSTFTPSGSKDSVEVVAPVIKAGGASKAFDTIISFLQGAPTKYYLVLNDNSGIALVGYECISEGWTDTELRQLIPVADVEPTIRPATCAATITTVGTKRQITFTNLTLVARSDSTQSITLSGNLTWAKPEAPTLAAVVADSAVVIQSDPSSAP